jgi:hypothetical protein
LAAGDQEIFYTLCYLGFGIDVPAVAVAVAF